MTPFWRNILDAAATLGVIVLGTLIVHLALSWWPALAALI
jgi:hypothetical protein